LLLSAIGGAVVGAAGLAWWLLSEAERRHRIQRQLSLPRRSRLQGGTQEPVNAEPAQAAIATAGAEQTQDGQLHDRVQQLNRAIDDVRRQLEELQPQP
jgi:hypothetical protein